MRDLRALPLVVVSWIAGGGGVRSLNFCTTCGLDFGSVRAFDAHRVGKHGYLYEEGLRMVPPRMDGRRCLSVPELEARGFVTNNYGRWSLPGRYLR